MDEHIERAEPQMAIDHLGHAVIESAERLGTRVGELRAQVRRLLPADDHVRRAAVSTGGQPGSLERIRALELLLQQAHEREHRLVIRAIRDRDRLAILEAEHGARVEQTGERYGQLANVTEFNRRIDAVRASQRAPRSIGTPWVELQHLVSSSVGPTAARERTEGQETGAEIVDLASADPEGRPVIRRLWGGRRHAPAAG